MLTTVLMLAAAWNAQPAACAPQFAPLGTGMYQGASGIPFWPKKDAGSWRGGGWLGWDWDTDSLRPVTLKIQDRPKRFEDDDEAVTVVVDPDVEYAVRCVPNVRAGPILQARDHDGPVMIESLEPNRPLAISLGQRRYEVRLSSATESLADARVVLAEGERIQLLYSADGFADDPHFLIEWAGDLDRDGRLDLVVNLSRKYSLHPRQLLLSSRASPRQLVGLVATFLTSD